MARKKKNAVIAAAQETENEAAQLPEQPVPTEETVTEETAAEETVPEVTPAEAPARRSSGKKTEPEDENAFAASLDELTVTDLAPDGISKKKHSMHWYINRALFIACIAVVCVCAVQMVIMIRGYGQAEDIYSDIAGQFYAAGDGSHAVEMQKTVDPSEMSMDYSTALRKAANGEEISADVEYDMEFELVRANLLSLQRKNHDLYGWVRVEGTNIDYPIMQYTDNEYYLSHAYTGDFVPAGAIFADSTCSRSLLDNHNLVLYGHNMSNGMMFNNVAKFQDGAFFLSHPYVVVTTLDGVFTYEIFAAYQTTMDDDYIRTYFDSHEAFAAWATEMESHSLFHKDGVFFSPYDRVITLSTCTGGFWKNRNTIQAKLVKVEHGLANTDQ